MFVPTKAFALGTQLENVADEAARIARDNWAMVAFESTNNSMLTGVHAACLSPARSELAPAQPTAMPIAIGTFKSAVRRWALSKSELVETIAAELGNGSLRIAREGDWEALQSELSAMELTVRASGSASYSARLGKHDDLVVA